MAQMELRNPFPAYAPFSEPPMLFVKSGFSFKLLRFEWKRDHYMAVAFGILALCLGSISTELWNGGDAKVSGQHHGDQWIPIFPSPLVFALLSVVCLPSVDVVSRHANSRRFIVGHVELPYGNANLLSPQQCSISPGFQTR